MSTNENGFESYCIVELFGHQKIAGKAFVIGQQSQARPREVGEPLPTVAGRGAIAMVEPYLVTTNWGKTNRSQPRSLD